MNRLIVNADDFGLSEKVNEGILDAHLHGIVTSASIMANGEAFEHAIDICKSTPTLDIGVHLTLVGEEPVVSSEHLPSLVNGEGRLHSHATEFLKRYLMRKICFQEVRKELEAQVISVISRGINVSHLDSHQHLHMLPKNWTVAVALARKYGIRAIRVSNERLHINVDMLRTNGSGSRVIHSFVLKFLSRLRKNADVVRTDHFVGFLFSGNLSKENLQTVLQKLPPTGTCEIMCHPGAYDPDSRYTHWRYNWPGELSALTDQEILQFVKHNRIKLISYQQL
jgi:hopanoid biosynthesis associated protein HpnK